VAASGEGVSLIPACQNERKWQSPYLRTLSSRLTSTFRQWDPIWLQQGRSSHPAMLSRLCGSGYNTVNVGIYLLTVCRSTAIYLTSQRRILLENLIIVRSASQDCTRFLWNTKVHHLCSKNSPPVPTLDHMDPVPVSTPCFYEASLILSSHLHLGLQSCLFPSGFPVKMLSIFILTSACYMLNWLINRSVKLNNLITFNLMSDSLNYLDSHLVFIHLIIIFLTHPLC
jgi:hypothetical protein